MKKYLLLLTFSFCFYSLSFSQVAPSIQWQNTIGGNDQDVSYSISQTADGGYITCGNSFSNTSGDKTEDCLGGYDYWVVKTDSAGNIQWQNTLGGQEWDQPMEVFQATDGNYVVAGYSMSDSSPDKSENSFGDYDYWIVKLDAQGNILYENTIGGSLGDLLYSAQQTMDGGYMLAGSSNSNMTGDKTEMSQGSYDYWLVKTDSAFNILWQNTIGGMGTDMLRSAQQTTDGGYILGGSSRSPLSGDKTENNINFSDDFWIIKTDSNGIIEWQNTLGGDSIDDNVFSILQTNDGGYLVGGRSRSDASADKIENCIGGFDYWIVKLSSTGNLQWENTIGGNYADELLDIDQTSDGGYLLGGHSGSGISGDKTENNIGLPDFWIVKTDSNGTLQWQNTIGGTAVDYLYSLMQTADGGYILSGYSNSDTTGDKTENQLGGGDYWILKLAPDMVTGISPITAASISGEEGVGIAPNPSSDEITISFPATASENTEIKIYNVTGEKVFEEKIKTPVVNYQLSTIHFQNGIYFVEVISDKRTAVRKVVVNH